MLSKQYYCKRISCVLGIIVCCTIIFTNLHSNVSFNLHKVDSATHFASKNVLVKGQPIFPFGFYYVDYDSSESRFVEKQMQALRNIASAGFNVLHASINFHLEYHSELLDEAEKLGVYVLSDHQASFARSKSIQALRNKPALMGWSIGDDVNSNYTRQEILNLNNYVKNLDPKHLTYISMYDPDPKVIAQYLNTSDLVGMQSYPVSSRPLSSTFSEIKAAVDTAEKNNAGPVVANLQAFQWNNADRGGTLQRQPNFSEIRNMTYQALLAGAKGIIYYTYRDQSWYLPDHPDLWKGLKSLVPEIEQLKPILLAGELTKFSSRVSNDVIIGKWSYKNQTVIVVINTSPKSQKISYVLPQSNLMLEPMFPNRSLGLTLRSGILSGVINPLDVHVYKAINQQQISAMNRR